jgi:chromosome segregation ATPase
MLFISGQLSLLKLPSLTLVFENLLQQNINHNRTEAMTSRGDFQRQLAQIMGDIKVQGFKFEDVMPDEMLVHFQDMVALKEARSYIKEGESRAKELQESNHNLLAQLQAKQAEIDNLPADFMALQVDLQQCRNEIAFQKELAEHERNRAERCQAKLKEACKVQFAASEDARRIQRLEQELASCIAARDTLFRQYRAAEDLHEAQHEQNLKLIDEQNDKLAALANHVSQLEEENFQAVELSEQVGDTYDSLINDIEKESSTAAEVVNAKSVQLFDQRRLNDELYAAIASELVPLTRFFDDTLKILSVYQSVFQDLTSPGFAELPQTLDNMLDSANDQLYAYQHLMTSLDIQYLLEKQGPAQQEVARQIDGMANVAARMYTSLDTLKEGISGFFNIVRQERIVGYGSLRLTPTSRSVPPRRSMSSLTSFAKRFSMSSPRLD